MINNCDLKTKTEGNKTVPVYYYGVKISEINREKPSTNYNYNLVKKKLVQIVGGTFKSFVRRTTVTFFTVYQYVSINVVKYGQKERNRERENE